MVAMAVEEAAPFLLLASEGVEVKLSLASPQGILAAEDKQVLVEAGVVVVQEVYLLLVVPVEVVGADLVGKVMPVPQAIQAARGLPQTPHLLIA